MQNASAAIDHFRIEKKDWGQVCKANVNLKKWIHHKKFHIKISPFTEFGDVWLDSDHVVSFQKSEK